MVEPPTRPKGGRQAEASRNDARVLAAAREVLATDPEASMAQIAKRAGTGIGTLYRRYPSKELLARDLCLSGMQQLGALAREASSRLNEGTEGAFAQFMESALEERAAALGRLAGTFVPGDELITASQSMRRSMQRLARAAQDAGELRSDVTADDIGLVLEQLQAIWLADDEGTRRLRRHHLGLHLQALHPDGAEPLPEGPPSWQQIQRRWGA